MLLTVDMPDASQFEIRDVTGRSLSHVMAYDTNTQEVEMVLCDEDGMVHYPFEVGEYRPVTIKTFLPGSYAIDKRTNTKVK